MQLSGNCLSLPSHSFVFCLCLHTTARPTTHLVTVGKTVQRGFGKCNLFSCSSAKYSNTRLPYLHIVEYDNDNDNVNSREVIKKDEPYKATSQEEICEINVDDDYNEVEHLAEEKLGEEIIDYLECNP